MLVNLARHFPAEIDEAVRLANKDTRPARRKLEEMQPHLEYLMVLLHQSTGAPSGSFDDIMKSMNKVVASATGLKSFFPLSKSHPRILPLMTSFAENCVFAIDNDTGVASLCINPDFMLGIRTGNPTTRRILLSQQKISRKGAAEQGFRGSDILMQVMMDAVRLFKASTLCSYLTEISIDLMQLMNAKTNVNSVIVLGVMTGNDTADNYRGHFSREPVFLEELGTLSLDLPTRMVRTSTVQVL